MKTIKSIIKKSLYIVPLILLTTFSSCKKSETKPEETPLPNYTNFKITSIKITAMPFLDSGSSGWDPIDGPDVFFKITDGTNILLNASSSRFSDCLVTF